MKHKINKFCHGKMKETFEPHKIGECEWDTYPNGDPVNFKQVEKAIGELAEKHLKNPRLYVSLPRWWPIYIGDGGECVSSYDFFPFGLINPKYNHDKYHDDFDQLVQQGLLDADNRDLQDSGYAIDEIKVKSSR